MEQERENLMGTAPPPKLTPIETIVRKTGDFMGPVQRLMIASRVVFDNEQSLGGQGQARRRAVPTLMQKVSLGDGPPVSYSYDCRRLPEEHQQWLLANLATLAQTDVSAAIDELAELVSELQAARDLLRVSQSQTS